jgi:hypothetical protein
MKTTLITRVFGLLFALIGFFLRLNDDSRGTYFLYGAILLGFIQLFFFYQNRKNNT